MFLSRVLSTVAPGVDRSMARIDLSSYMPPSYHYRNTMSRGNCESQCRGETSVQKLRRPTAEHLGWPSFSKSLFNYFRRRLTKKNPTIPLPARSILDGSEPGTAAADADAPSRQAPLSGIMVHRNDRPFAKECTRILQLTLSYSSTRHATEKVESLANVYSRLRLEVNQKQG